MAEKAAGMDTAVILCGGLGTRLRPLTLTLPKSLIRVQGRPVLEHLLLLFKRYGIRKIILCVGYLGDKIEEYFRDGSGLGMQIEYVKEESPLGTGGPLRVIKEKGMLPKGPFIVSNGDELKDIDFNEMLRFHLRGKASATIALTEVEDPSAYGVARMKGNMILEFVEKPEKGKAPSDLISSGTYIFSPETVSLIPPGHSMLEKGLFPKLAAERRLYGYVFKGQWFDTGTFERLEKAEREWKGI